MDLFLKNPYLFFLVFSAVCGKCPSQLLRLSGILQLLHDAFDFVKTLELENLVLNENFISLSQEYIKTQTNNLIDVENMDRAYNLLEFYNKNKLILAGYTFFDWQTEIHQIFLKLLENNKKKESTNSSLENIISKYILTSSFDEFKLNDINQKYKNKGCSAKFVREHFLKLNSQGFGVLKDCPNASGPKSEIFKKVFISEPTLANINDIAY